MQTNHITSEKWDATSSENPAIQENILVGCSLMNVIVNITDAFPADS